MHGRMNRAQRGRWGHSQRRMAPSMLVATLSLLAYGAQPGCVLLSDVLNPQAILGFGFDPATVFPSTGTVIVTVTNGTNFRTTFSVVHAANGADLLRSGRTAAFDVEPGQTGNVVLSCPVEVVIPGVLTPAGEVDTTAAIVQQNDAGTAVNYAGPAIVQPRMFTCGDVIAFTVAAAAGAENEFVITTRIIKGQ
jgi:hypothetical protein